MSYTHFLIFTLIFAIIAINKVQSGCDSEMCNEVCHAWSLNGTCVGDECDCSTNKECIDLACDKVCDLFDLHLEGECNDYNQCICKPKLEPCAPPECQLQCEEDPRVSSCMAVLADFCLWYGPIRTCGCICYQWPWLSRFNRFVPAEKKISTAKMLPAKKSPKLHRNFYRVVPRI